MKVTRKNRPVLIKLSAKEARTLMRIMGSNIQIPKLFESVGRKEEIYTFQTRLHNELVEAGAGVKS